ncbi:hypothetical protein [Halalkalibacter sp. APA_J-10(15)]|uniref:hypothetical protein n=1 Tax=Halalkalibacter sp. APA_J-10(15) TaxID=2933805 RepID=UPI001FF66A72|nr:hypothetical protein [Halalkalibacter sp. APA_J-10(15)]MCK0470862.1 hypothetical protein [Halalkalibacter sp. APA_J-10(15)]
MIKVVDASVTSKRGAFTNMAMVDFKIEGEEQTFGINFYNQEIQGVVYLFPELKARGIKDPGDTEQLSKDVLAVLEAKGESIDVTLEEKLAHKENWLKSITVSKEEKHAILGRMLKGLESDEQREEFKRRIEAVIK